MAISVVASGSLAADGTEQSLTTSTTSAVFILVIDGNVLQNGDIVELRLKTKVLGGSTAREAYYAVYAHTQTQPNKYSPPVPSNNSIQATLKQTAGTNRTFDWVLLSVS